MYGLSVHRLYAILLLGMTVFVAGCLEVTPVHVDQLWDHYGIYIIINIGIICAVVLPLVYVYLKGSREGEEVEGKTTPPMEPGLNNPDDGMTCPHCGGINKKGNKITNTKYKKLRHCYEGMIAVKTDKGWGFIDEEGTIKIKPRFDYCGSFNEGLSVIGLFISRDRFPFDFVVYTSFKLSAMLTF